MSHDPQHGSEVLRIFISSTADLKAERDVVQRTLDELDIEGTRFESWPASPSPPLEECFRHIDESDALILLFGQRYGTKGSDGLSATHAEYRHAARKRKPIFAFLLKRGAREPEQDAFIGEVEKHQWHGPEAQNLDELRREVRRALLQEFTRCFRDVHAAPPDQLSQVRQSELEMPPLALPRDDRGALEAIKRLYLGGYDAELHVLRQECLSRFGTNADVLNILYMAEVNRGLNGMEYDSRLVEEAVPFWQGDEARRRWVGYSLLYNQGNALLALKRFAAAIEKYKEALQLQPDIAECWKNLGSAHLGLGRKDLAKECFEKALQYKPGLFEALYCLGTQLAAEEGQTGRALECMEAINVEALPRALQAAVLGWKCILFLRMSKYKEGIESGEGAIQSDPDQKWAWANTARLYVVARRDDKQWLKPALDFWERYVGRFPNSADAYSELGFTSWFLWRRSKGTERGQVLARKALSAFQRAIQYGQRDDGLLWDRMGHIHEGLGELAEAEKAFLEAVARDRPRFLYCLADCLISQKRFQEALPLALESAEKYQQDAHGWFQVGACYSDLRMFDKAIAAYEEAIDRDPGYPNPWFDLGGSYWNLGLRAEAKRVWTEAMKKFPHHALTKRVERFLASSDG